MRAMCIGLRFFNDVCPSDLFSFLSPFLCSPPPLLLPSPLPSPPFPPILINVYICFDIQISVLIGVAIESARMTHNHPTGMEGQQRAGEGEREKKRRRRRGRGEVEKRRRRGKQLI